MAGRKLPHLTLLFVACIFFASSEKKKDEVTEEEVEEIKNLLELEGRLADKINAYCDAEIARLKKLKE